MTMTEFSHSECDAGNSEIRARNKSHIMQYLELAIEAVSAAGEKQQQNSYSTEIFCFLTNLPQFLQKKTDAPEELEEVNVTGISVEGQETSLLVDDEDIVMVPTELLLAACREGQSPEGLASELPITVKIIRKGREIEDLSIIQ
ncbi:uncharacterized protein LOC128215132 [Mya arenaria]|uniref:uncharacterized protein LOC128215132 n=1 Tax=Mya arenaria TaxID=6604 RepID=UPI0022E28BCB|nr:uncharacterized protein LOC128215132 [Mya arenaria]